ENMKFAIITNSFGRDVALVERSLKHSLSQVPAADVVIFIDQNREKLRFVEEIENHPKLRHLHICVNAVSAARNSFEIPDVDWMIFCDDDGYLADGYTKKFLIFISENSRLEIVAGSIV